MADLQGRSYTWAFMIYPESMPENWLEIIRDFHTLGAISPIHDQDVNPTGEFKKSHRHVLLKFPTKKSYLQILMMANKLGSSVPPEAVDNFDGYLRYLIHIDNPEKYQYDVKDIIPLCGIDVESYFQPSKSRLSAVIQEIVSFLLEREDILDFEVLRRLSVGNKEWTYALDMTPAYSVHKILQARVWKIKFQKEDK